MSITCHRIDTGLGCWTHSEWRPAREHPLSWVVERIWDFDGRVAHRRERVFPTGIVELIVQLDDRYHDVDETGVTLTPPTCVTGIQTGPLVIEAPPGRCRVLGVRFHPPGAWAILGHPLSELTGLTTDLEAMVGPAALELAECCDDAGTATERLRRTIIWLCARLDRSVVARRLSPVVRQVAGCVARTGGVVRIDALRTEVGWSTGRLSSAFLEQVGVTPKRYARIHRFRHALDRLREPGASLAGVALRTGYYDQPHMNADFRELAGMSPRQFLAAQRYPSSTSAAEA